MPQTPISPVDIQEIAGVVPDTVINDFAQVLGIEVEDTMDVDDVPKKKQVGFEPIKGKVKFLMREGYSASQIISQVCTIITKLRSANQLQLHDVVIFHPTLTPRQKSACALLFAEADKALCDGADEELWVLDAALRVHKAIAG